MTIQERIDWALTKTEDLRKTHTEITNVRYEFKDISYSELREYAMQEKCKLHTTEDRAYIILCTFASKYDTDIWLYSKPIKIKPAEIIEE